MLSITLGDRASPEDAFIHHVRVLHLESGGTWGVTVAEVTDAGLHSYEEPLDNSPDHGFIDFRELGRSQVERKAKVLLSRARDRGCLHQQ